VQNFKILIISAVKISKQCLQATSACGDLGHLQNLYWGRPWTQLWEFLGYSPTRKFLVTLLFMGTNKNHSRSVQVRPMKLWQNDTLVHHQTLFHNEHILHSLQLVYTTPPTTKPATNQKGTSIRDMTTGAKADPGV